MKTHSRPPEAVRKKVEHFARLFEAHQTNVLDSARQIAGAQLPTDAASLDRGRLSRLRGATERHPGR